MAYFLKKTTNKKGEYLQIYESYHDPSRGYAAHRAYKPIGYVHELNASGIEDPINYYKKEVESLNLQLKLSKQQDKIKLISDESPERFLGYFPIKNIHDSLGVKGHLNLLQKLYNFDFNVYEVLSSLIYARMIQPCSKQKTFHDVLPKLFEPFDFSLNQLYSTCEFLGTEYEKVIQIYNNFIQKKYAFDTSTTYFDCTNFYFEIDQEDQLRRKGPSKENRKDPIVGMGLLLDANQIPIGMKIFPGNESEQPIFRDVITSLKQSQNIEGRTIRVADKGLNSAQNIVHAREQGDGYIFSKSVKKLPAIEKQWVLLANDYQEVCDSKGKVLYHIKECIDEFPYTITLENGMKKTIKLKEKRVVTYNPKLAKKQNLEIQRQVEKAKTLRASQAKRDEYGDSAKFVIFESTDTSGKTTEGKVKVSLNEKAITEAKILAGYNLIVTSEVKLSAKTIYDTYHNLWRIEESFKIMKSELEARPAFMQRESTIIGHFLICYLSVVMMRLLQFRVLNNKYSSEDIIGFIKNFKTVKVSSNQYINISKYTDFIKDLIKQTGLPLNVYYLNNSQIKEMLSHRF